jgi:outer membrane protein OmpA-like peptidoglycan-associated protein
VQAEENVRLAKIAAEKKSQDDLKAKEAAILQAKADAEAAIAQAKAEAEAEILKLKAEAQALAQKNEEEKAAAAPVVKARKKLPLEEQIKKEKEAIPMEAAPAPAEKPVVKEVVAPKEKKPVVISDDAFSETIILYISNSGQLMPETKGKLNRIISNMKARPEVKIKVEGHSDNEGTFRNNLKVSRIREMKVLRYLYRYGIPEKRIIAIAHGETRPAATNKTQEGRKLNRRVEISLVK